MPTYTPLPTNVSELKKALCTGAITPAERQKCARLAKQLALVHCDFNQLSAAVTRLNMDEQALAQQMKEVSSGVSLQYLQLQEKVQRENREIALIRNIKVEARHNEKLDQQHQVSRGTHSRRLTVALAAPRRLDKAMSPMLREDKTARVERIPGKTTGCFRLTTAPDEYPRDNGAAAKRI